MTQQIKKLGGPLPNRWLIDKDSYRICKQKEQWKKYFPILEKKNSKEKFLSSDQ